MTKITKEKIIKNLEAISEEIACDEIESNQSMLDLLDDVVMYLDDKDEFFIDNERYEDVEEFVDSIKSCISELRCDYADKDTIKYLKDALEIIKEDV